MHIQVGDLVKFSPGLIRGSLMRSSSIILVGGIDGEIDSTVNRPCQFFKHQTAIVLKLLFYSDNDWAKILTSGGDLGWIYCGEISKIKK
jgi:hypothetical protein